VKIAAARLSLVLVMAGVATACQTSQQMLDQTEPQAIQTAEARGRFEMSCPSAAATVLSREIVQPALQGPLVAGIPRSEYAVGVSGCGERMTFVVICPEGSAGCFAGEGRQDGG
jgi:hypothetical protein